MSPWQLGLTTPPHILTAVPLDPNLNDLHQVSPHRLGPREIVGCHLFTPPPHTHTLCRPGLVLVVLERVKLCVKHSFLQQLEIVKQSLRIQGNLTREMGGDSKGCWENRSSDQTNTVLVKSPART